jgi:hypothetical protein
MWSVGISTDRNIVLADVNSVTYYNVVQGVTLTTALSLSAAILSFGAALCGILNKYYFAASRLSKKIL